MERLSPPLTEVQLTALRNIYDIPMELTNGFRYNDGRWFGSEAQWKSSYNALLGYLRDSVPRWDETYHPSGGRPTDEEIKRWNPLDSPAYIQIDLRREDCNGHLARPLIIMHGAADPIVSPGEAEGYKDLVAKTIGPTAAENLLAVYYIAEALVGNRVSKETEIEGLDFPEMGIGGYAGVVLDKAGETPMMPGDHYPGGDAPTPKPIPAMAGKMGLSSAQGA